MIEHNMSLCSKWYNCRIRILSDNLITFKYSLTKFLVYFFCLSCRPKLNYALIGYNLFDKIKPCIKHDEGTCLFLRATCQSYLIICSYLVKMEWTEDHDIQLAKEFLSEP